MHCDQRPRRVAENAPPAHCATTSRGILIPDDGDPHAPLELERLRRREERLEPRFRYAVVDFRMLYAVHSAFEYSVCLK